MLYVEGCLCFMDILQDATMEEMKKGYSEDQRNYSCLFCDKKVPKGVIYPVNDSLFEDWRYMEQHIEDVHGSVFGMLLSTGKDGTGLSDQQSKLLALMYEGKTDKDIQQELKIGSMSTIRNHRFALRKKERQANTLLALMELLHQQEAQVTVKPQQEKVVQRSFVPSAKLQRYFSEEDGRLISYNLKEYEREQLVQEVALLFRPKKVYTEKEVNAILQEVYEDYMLLRREMVDRGMLARNAEGSEYRIIDKREEESEMDYKKELKLKAKEEKTSYGIYQIKNRANGKMLIGSTRNFKTLNGIKFSLNNNVSTNKELQADWNEYGKEQFEFVELEVVDEKDWKGMSSKRILEKLLEKWLEELQPYGENGYNEMKVK